MSSRPDPPDLEGFIEDSFFLDRLPPGSRERLIRYYEPFRRLIEHAMEEDYDPETMSWRDWRNSYWSLLPDAPLEEIKMSDEEIRALERAAVTDPDALLRLTAVRLRRAEGVIFVWVEEPMRPVLNLGRGPTPPPEPATPPAGALEVTVHGVSFGGDLVIGEGASQPRTPPDRRGWVLACLDVQDAIFARVDLPRATGVSGPGLLELHTGRYVSRVSFSGSVSISEPGRNAV